MNTPLKLVIVGHVDHGKSTLIGRLIHDTGNLPEGKFEAIKASCDKRGMPFEWSFLLDALQTERDQGITIDTTQIHFKTAKRAYTIIDAPGHKEFLKNMISGAASADAAIIVIDAKEGVKEQSKRHGYLLHLLGIRQIAVAVNKMDLVDYSDARFEEIKREYTDYLASVGVTPTVFIPISAREGVGITEHLSHRERSAKAQPETGEGNKKLPLPENLLDFARTLRRDQTDAENLMWHLLRNRALGVKFRRQHPVGKYIADFCCLEYKLIIELDGCQHGEDSAQHYDAVRDEYLKKEGYTVLRVWNNDLLQRTESVLEAIWNTLFPHPKSQAILTSPDGRGVSVLQALDSFHPTPSLEHLPLRLPVQDVYKFDERRILAGRIESGSLTVGDEILFSPSNKTTRVVSIEEWPTPLPSGEVAERSDAGEGNNANTIPHPKSQAILTSPDGRGVRVAGQSIGITLEHPLFIERGETISHAANAPLLSNLLKARIIWLGDAPLTLGKTYKIKLQTAEYMAELRSIETALDTDSLDRSAATCIERHGVGEVTFRLRGLAALDDHAQNPRTGRFVIVDGYDMVGGGIISLDGIEDQRVSPTAVKSQNLTEVAQQVSLAQRTARNGHQPGILWLTGLSGSGKSTLSQELQTRLFAKGYQVVVLDGDNVRHGLCSDLGFSPEDRSENIRRVGEVAALFARAGFIVITAFISPYIADRKRARAAAPDLFHTVYVEAPLETCETRDVKGLYAKARRGEIKGFTGIDDPYEPPQNPDLTIDTSKCNIEEGVAMLVRYVEEKLGG